LKVVFWLRAERYCNNCGAYVGDIPYSVGCSVLSKWFLIYLAKWIRSLIKKYKEEISSINCEKCTKYENKGGF